MIKADFCICENKGTDQLRGDSIAEQDLCFHYVDSTVPLLVGNPEDRFSHDYFCNLGFYGEIGKIIC